MACARRRIGPEARVRTFRESGHQRVVADADERAAEIADVGTREPQTGLLILNLLPSGAAVGDDDRRAVSGWPSYQSEGKTSARAARIAARTASPDCHPSSRASGYFACNSAAAGPSPI